MLSRARAGNEEDSVWALMEAARPVLLRLAEATCSQLAQAGPEAADLVQETLIKAQQQFHSFSAETESQFFCWLHRIMVNKIRDHLRGRTRLKRDARRQISLASLAEAELAHCASPEEEIEREEAHEELRKAVLRLPTRLQQVVTARFFDDLAFIKVGERMGCSAEAARKSCDRALKLLARHLC